MEHNHIRLCHFHFLFVENVEIFQTDVILFVEETLFLNAGHVKNVQLGQLVFQTDDFFIRNIFFTQHLCDIIRNPQLGRGNEDEPEVVVAGERVD